MVSISERNFFEPARVGIQTTLLTRDETLELEPNLIQSYQSVKVPDGAIDPFTLVLENAKDAEGHGAKSSSYRHYLFDPGW